MLRIDQLRAGTRIEFRSFDDWKGYASVMGFHMDVQRAQRRGFCRMRRDIGVVVNFSIPRYFEYEVIS